MASYIIYVAGAAGGRRSRKLAGPCAGDSGARTGTDVSTVVGGWLNGIL